MQVSLLPTVPQSPSCSLLRVALYSHDSCGLGHLRRNILIGKTLLHEGVASSVLLICGAHEANQYRLPAGLDVLTLPSLQKRSDGTYQARRLDIDLEHLREIRSSIIDSALEAFRPDLVVVDNVPRGANGELEVALERGFGQRAWRSEARIVLGLRDVLDQPDAVMVEWSRLRNFEFIRKVYDEIWVYGDRAVYDLTEEYQFPPDIRDKVRFTGYLDRGSAVEFAAEATHCTDDRVGRRHPGARPYALCMVGGGQDGYDLASVFLDAARQTRVRARLVTGPYMPDEEVRALVASVHGSRIEVLRFVSNPLETIRSADRVVAMGGYNTVCEVLSQAKPMLLVPRVRPRTEQLIRGHRLEALGLVSLMQPDEVSQASIAAWLSASAPSATDARSIIDFDGIRRVASFAAHAQSATRYAQA